jgi:hypothetical protein
MQFGIDPPKDADPPWHWGARAIYMRSDPTLRLAQAKKLKKGEKAHVPRVLDLLPDRQDFIVKDGEDKKASLAVLNLAWGKIRDIIETRFHNENIDPTCEDYFDGEYEGTDLPCVYAYTFRPAGGYVYLGIWPSARKPPTPLIGATVRTHYRIEHCPDRKPHEPHQFDGEHCSCGESRGRLSMKEVT